MIEYEGFIYLDVYRTGTRTVVDDVTDTLLFVRLSPNGLLPSAGGSSPAGRLRLSSAKSAKRPSSSSSASVAPAFASAAAPAPYTATYEVRRNGVIVQKRSYLNPGTERFPGERSDYDRAVPQAAE